MRIKFILVFPDAKGKAIKIKSRNVAGIEEKVTELAVLPRV